MRTHIALALMILGCAAPPAKVGSEPQVLVAHLAGPKDAAFDALRDEFEQRNPGYQVEWFDRLALTLADVTQVLMVQTGKGLAEVGGARAEVGPGDVIVLRAGEELRVDPPIAALSFRVPEAPATSLPTFLRPDLDPRITDTPGGCATANDAYRRVLLTWSAENGPYVFHGLNVHRVRITDGFTHFHPPATGFDELYLVQGRLPEGELLTSSSREAIEAERDLPADAFERRRLEVGDLVLIPRGIVHRGLGGVLAQVIAVPGFLPGQEVGVDHHLRAIAERTPSAAPPFNREHADGPHVK